MYSQILVGLALSLPVVHAETIIGAYVFHRHGDRSAKALPPVGLTDLGYSEVYASGQWFRENYVGASGIAGLATDNVVNGQLYISAPDDPVLMNSASGFLQGLYPPVGATLGSQTLRNGTTIQTPLDGFQLIPVHTVTTGTGTESSVWLQGSSGCANALTSSNEYFQTAQYQTLLNSTAELYQGLVPVLNGTFNTTTSTFKNAYAIYDVLNVAEIHNATLNTTILTDPIFFQTRTLADTHEYNLAYNASSPIRAVAGATLAAQILQALNSTITTASAPKLNIQFGAYASFFSFFGLAQLPAANPDFMGIPDYASFMTFELATNDTSSNPLADVSQIGVRFLFHNGTVSNSSAPQAFPLFGQQETVIPWSTFVDQMNIIAIGDQNAWCSACGNTTGICASSSAATSSTSHTGGMSKAVAGVIGAMVTLAVILGAEALIMLLAGLRLSKKNRRGAAASPAGPEEGDHAASEKKAGY